MTHIPEVVIVDLDNSEIVEVVTVGPQSPSYAATVVAAEEKTTPVDADLVGIVDSAASNVIKKLTWANLKSAASSVVIDWTNPNAITGTANAIISRENICSGTSVDYTATLPDGTGLSVGDQLVVTISTACTKMITVDGFSAQLVGKELAYVLRAGETLRLEWNGTYWTVLVDGRIPMKFYAYISASPAGFAKGTWNKVLIETELFDDGGVFDVSNNKLVVRRNSTWDIETQVTMTRDGSGNIIQALAAIMIDGNTSDRVLITTLFRMGVGAGQETSGGAGTGKHNLVTGKDYEVYAFCDKDAGTFAILGGLSGEAGLTNISGTEVL